MVNIQVQVSDLEYQEYAIKNRHAAEDEFAAQADYDRQKGWYDEAEDDLDALRTERADLQDTEGNVSEANQAEYSRLGTEITNAEGQLTALQETLNEFLE